MQIKNTKIKKGIFVIVAILFGIFVASFLFENIINTNQGLEVNQENNLASVTSSIQKEEKAKYFYFNRESKEYATKLKISADSYIVGDLYTGEVILAKNPNKKLPIASVSKLMTAVVADEIKNEDDIAKVSKKALATYGSNGNFKVGEKIKISDLLYPLLLESSNDASEIIAEHYERDVFLNKMNTLAKKLKMVSTYYNDPSGLSEKNQSTVADLFKLTGYLKQKKDNILQMTTERSYSNKTHTWFSTNQFLKEDAYTGGKSGFTNPAKQTVVSTFSLPLAKDVERPIAIVLLGSQDRKKDVTNILNYLKKNIYYGGAKDASADWIKERLDIPDIREPDFVNLAFLGDMMLDRGVRSSVNKNFKGDYSALFEKLNVLKKSDMIFANLEGPASDQGKDMGNLYSFRMDPSVVPALKGAGIGIVSMANNHVGDWGRSAFADTLARLEENEILYTGAGTKDTIENPTIVEKYGIKIGYLGFSDVGPHWMTPTEDNPGILLANNPRFKEIIQNASKQVDYLIVSFHFGDEYKTIHNKRQEKLAHDAIDSGAKIVIGHHPHVVQDTEIYKNGFIAYSLGNFIFDQKFSEATMQGMFLEIKLHRDGNINIKKNIIQLNKVFQPEKILYGKEEKIIFKEN